MGAVLMQTQHVARRSSDSACFAAFPSQNGMTLSSAYRDIRNSVILRQCASVEARISHERLAGENTPPELEQNDRSKECLRRLKPFAHLALWSQFRPAAAIRPPMMNMLLLTQHRSLLNRHTPANTNRTVAERAARPALPHMLHGGSTFIKEGTPC